MVVNENPNANYAKEDAERTPDLRKCFARARVLAQLAENPVTVIALERAGVIYAA